MKKLIVLFVVLFCINLFSQEESNSSFSNFKLGLLAGVNVSKLTGGSVLIEGKINLTSHLNLKAMIGYSKINKKEGYNIKTFGFMNIYDPTISNKYTTVSYDLERIDYDVFPIGIGFEYLIMKDKLSPYIVGEAGYNFYAYHIQESFSKVGEAGYYDSYDELPSEYKNKRPEISNEDSYLLGLGVGTNYKLSSAINLDLRYIYQFNKNIVNTNHVLVGINF